MGRGGDLETSVRKVLPKDEQVRQSSPANSPEPFCEQVLPLGRFSSCYGSREKKL